ncbi:hypothetical protein BKA66DRAFT_454479 [Pyrenochaeta sp. MPI-SDFR-AT-0127]|nr:hypothetical protein BKA66DRAFT_454479 [Pyrenochaeta sp. MPI-SDFR-AT-0127]
MTMTLTTTLVAPNNSRITRKQSYRDGRTTFCVSGIIITAVSLAVSRSSTFAISCRRQKRTSKADSAISSKTTSFLAITQVMRVILVSQRRMVLTRMYTSCTIAELTPDRTSRTLNPLYLVRQTLPTHQIPMMNSQHLLKLGICLMKIL